MTTKARYVWVRWNNVNTFTRYECEVLGWPIERAEDKNGIDIADAIALIWLED